MLAEAPFGVMGGVDDDSEDNNDNVLPPDYLATMIEDLAMEHDFAYPSKPFIGSDETWYRHREVDSNDLWEPPVEDRAKLWSRHFADTCRLVRWNAFLAGGAPIQQTRGSTSSFSGCREMISR